MKSGESEKVNTMKLIDSNYRTVTLKLPRWMVCRLLVMLSAMVDSNYLRPSWNIKVHDTIKEQLSVHDMKWSAGHD